ncbi:MAG: hypothetical protein IKC05_00445, partial [Lentisphaeria bacterium]|nr:hypothetical protein [Lentisphaeria bacterium]
PRTPHHFSKKAEYWVLVIQAVSVLICSSLKAHRPYGPHGPHGPSNACLFQIKSWHNPRFFVMTFALISLEKN